ncbi:hypothetical protein BDD21_4037 [Thiocapsa rosea]|uniref:Uncharacterized protein n=1 Tax=Thiocapsa rosea TaxID=69360 RepID=A0A495VAY8_9GAMM|nr:hypothetical protein BDD21_4037 [Thiocapsa rosea]
MSAVSVPCGAAEASETVGSVSSAVLVIDRLGLLVVRDSEVAAGNGDHMATPNQKAVSAPKN